VDERKQRANNLSPALSGGASLLGLLGALLLGDGGKLGTDTITANGLGTGKLAGRSVGSILRFTAGTLSVTTGNGFAVTDGLGSTLDPTRAEVAVSAAASSCLTVHGVGGSSQIALFVNRGITSVALVDAISAT